MRRGGDGEGGRRDSATGSSRWRCKRHCVISALQMIGFLLCSSALGAPFSYEGGARASLDYNPKVANAPSAISFSITSDSFRVPAGSKVELSLPRFTLCNDTLTCSVERMIFTLHQVQNINSNANWNEASKILVIEVPADISPGGTITGTIPVSNGLRLPRAGLAKDAPDLKVGGSVFKSPVVGSFVPDIGQERDFPSLGFVAVSPDAEPRAGRPIDLKIEFRHRMQIKEGETVTLTLPYFSGDNFGSMQSWNNDTSKRRTLMEDFQASWNNDTSKLTLEAQRDLPKDTPHSILVKCLPAACLSLPSNGNAKDFQELTIESNAVLGIVSPVPILSPHVQGIFYESSLSFCEGQCTFNGFDWFCTTNRARPAKRAEITLSLVVDNYMCFDPGETIALKLPGFGGADRQNIPLLTQPLCTEGLDPPLYPSTLAREQHPYGCSSNAICQDLTYKGSGIFTIASWQHATQTLTLTAAATLCEEESMLGKLRFVVVVPMHAGITLPSMGIRTNTRTLQLKSDLKRGPVPPAPLLKVLGVGALQNVSIIFEPAIPGDPTQVQFSFAPSMSLAVGDALVLELVGLNQTDVPEGTPPAGSFTSSPPVFRTGMSWNKVSNELTLECIKNAPAGALISIKIERSFGLKLPLEGVVPSSGKLVFTLISKQEPVPQSIVTAIQRVPPVLDATELAYGASSGFNYSTLRFKFTARRPLNINDEVTLRLNLFSGKTSEKLPSEATSGKVIQSEDYVKSYTWRANKLEFVLAKAVGMDETITITFAESANIALPIFGMPANSSLLTVSTKFGDGQFMAEVPIETSPSISPVLNSANVTFGAARAGAPTSLKLAFAAAFNFAINDTVSLRLAGFLSDISNNDISEYLQSNGDVDKAEMTTDTLANKVIKLRVKKPFSSTIVTLTSGSGIKLPAAGVRVKTQIIQIEGVLSMGSFNWNTVPIVEAIGALQGSAKLSFTAPYAGQATGFSMEFRAHMVLYPGDTLTLVLQNFSGPDIPRLELAESTPAKAVRRASWSSTDYRITFTVGSERPIPALTDITVKFPASPFLDLPGTRLYMPKSGALTCADVNQASCPISFSANAQEGSILSDPRTWVTDYTAVGGLVPSFRCTPPTPSKSTSLELWFSYNEPLQPGNMVSLKLGSFYLQSTPTNKWLSTNDIVTLALKDSGVFDTVTLSQSVSTQPVVIDFVAARPAAASITHVLRIPISAGLTIPPRGIPWEDRGAFKISIETATSKVLNQPIINNYENVAETIGKVERLYERVSDDRVGRVGAVLDSSFKLDPPSAGYVTELTIAFQPTMSMFAGESLTFVLPGFTGPDRIVLKGACRVYNETGRTYRTMPPGDSYFGEMIWTAASENITVKIRRILPAETSLMVIIPRSGSIAVPGAGLSENQFKSSMFLYSSSRNGLIEKQPIEFSGGIPIPSVIITNSLEVLPKVSSLPVRITFQFTASVLWNAGATILLKLPKFQNGIGCWDALPGEPGLALRCLTGKRSGNCDASGTPKCSPDDPRYCEEVPPWINAFIKKAEGGCKFRPYIRLGAHGGGSSVVQPNCECLSGAEYDKVFAQVQQYWNESGGGIDGYPLPDKYGSECFPWDSRKCKKSFDQPSCQLQATGNTDCSKLFRGRTGPHCCSSFCFVPDNCPTGVRWHGYSPSYNAEVAKITYDACKDPFPDVVQKCPFAFPPEGYDDVAIASWTRNDNNLVLTLSKQIVAFTPITVYIPIEQGITTPTVGISKSVPALVPMVDFLDNVARIRTSPQIVNLVDQISSFSDATLSVVEFTPGFAVDIVIRFTPNMNMNAGDTVYFILRDFKSDVSLTNDIASEPRNIRGGRWNAQKEMLEVLLTADLPKNTEMAVYIPAKGTPGFLRIPVSGLSPTISQLFTFTKCLDIRRCEGELTIESRYPIKLLQKIVAVWNTAVTFDPPLFDEPFTITFDFMTKVQLVEGDTVTFTMKGFTGPITQEDTPNGLGSWLINLKSAEPAQTFDILWKNTNTGPPEITLRIKPDVELPTDTTFTFQVPQNCTFLDLFNNCLDGHIMHPAPVQGKQYDPRALYVSMKTQGGILHRAFVRISSLLTRRPEMSSLEGVWEGFSYSSSGFLQDASVTHLMECLSSGDLCPTRSTYSCKATISNATVIVSGEKLRMNTDRSTVDFDETGATYENSNTGADFQILSLRNNNLVMRNLTASNYLVPDDKEVNTSGTISCSYARIVYQVELQGTYEVALELYTEYVFRTLDASTTNIRLRLNITADPFFNPVGLELYDADWRGLLRTAFSKAWGVGIDSIRFSRARNYPSVLECKQKPQCNVEVFVYGETAWQKRNGKLWARKVFESIYDGSLQYHLEYSNLIIYVAHTEVMFLSPDTYVSPVCPRSPKGRISTPYGNWLQWMSQTEERSIGVKVADNTYGIPSNDSAKCWKRKGVNTIDSLVYENDGYTVEFGIISILTRRDTKKAEIQNWDANGDSNISNIFLNRAKKKSAGTRSSPLGRASLFICTIFMCICASLVTKV